MVTSEWTRVEKEYLKKHYADTSAGEIASHLGRTRAAVSNRASRLGLRKHRREWETDVRDVIAELCEFGITELLSDDIGASEEEIKSFAEGVCLDRGIKGSKRSVDHAFFSEWSPGMATVLGFLMADGHLSIDRGNLEMSIDKRDIQYLRDVRFMMSSNYPIYANGSTRTLRAHSEHIVEDLVDLGITQRKSLDLEWVDVPREFLRHFVLGYFDGDGCIASRRHRQRKFPDIIIVGTMDFLGKMSKVISESVDVSAEGPKLARLQGPATIERGVPDNWAWTENGDSTYATNGVTGCLKYHGENAIKLGAWMYKGAALKLHRKYVHWLEFYENYLATGFVGIEVGDGAHKRPPRKQGC